MAQILDQLKAVEAFKNLPEAQLKWLVERGRIEEYDAGGKIFSKNDPFNSMRIVLDGMISIRLEQKGQYREFGRVETGGITGILPYSRAGQHIGSGIAAKRTVVLSLHKRHFPEMIRLHHEMVEALVHIMISRVREYSKIRHHDEKLMSLGKLSAGLAHELNNPSSAIVRSARELKQNLRTAPDKLKSVISTTLSPQQMDAVNDILLAKVERDDAQRNLTLMEKNARIDELAEWLEDHGIEDGLGIAETLNEHDFSAGELETILDTVSSDYFPQVVEWMDNGLTTEKLVQEIEDAATRITVLVNSIKTYSHLDQAPDKQPSNIRQGLTSTLTMLNHKLKNKNIQVDLDLPDDLPNINAFVGELNQVWTNIIDNAIDAMEKDGKLQISVVKDGESVLARIKDNGQGIPAEFQSRIFDPFFTTKGVGEGVGLGLNIVYKIIQHHNGDIKVISEPGRTEFRICIPIK